MIDALAHNDTTLQALWNRGVSNSALLARFSAVAFQIVIYEKLFASTVQAFLKLRPGVPRFDVEFRMDYIKYCIPNEMCQSYEAMTVLLVEPHAKPDNGSKRNELMLDRDLD